MIVQAPALGERALIDAWCNGPRVVIVTIVADRDSILDNKAAPLHLEWECETRRGTTSILDCLEGSREAGPDRRIKKWRSSDGTFLCPMGAKLFLVGGLGMWTVEVEGAPSPCLLENRQRFELQRVVDMRVSPDHMWIPTGHTHIECVAGFFNVGGVTVPPHKPIVASLAQQAGWQAQGIIKTYLEV